MKELVDKIYNWIKTIKESLSDGAFDITENCSLNVKALYNL